MSEQPEAVDCKARHVVPDRVEPCPHAPTEEFVYDETPGQYVALHSVPISLARLTLETGEDGIPGKVMFSLRFNPGSPLARPGGILTFRAPNGATYEAECLDVDAGVGRDGEYREICTIGPVKFTPPEPPA